MLLFKKILLFILSLFFIILFFIASSTSYAKSEYNAETLEKNVRFYSIEFLDIPDENGKKYVCGTKISTYDYSGRKYIIEYYYLLTNKNQIVTQFSVDAIQNGRGDKPQRSKATEHQKDITIALSSWPIVY